MDEYNSETVKHAVKEALNDKRMEDLSSQLINLATQMTAGFAAVTTRLDTTNGKVLKHDAVLAAQNTKNTYDKLIWLLLTTLVGLVVYFVTKGH